MMRRSGIALSIAGMAIVVPLAACSTEPPLPPPLSGRVVASRCLGVDLPVETAVRMFGVYEGAPAPGERERKAGEHRPMRVAISTGPTMGPEVLILSSYEPVVWDVSAVAAKDLRGVVVYGYYQSRVIGVPETLAVRQVAFRGVDDRSEQEPERAPDCGEPAWVFEGGPDLEKLDAQVAERVGLPIAHFAGAYSTDRLSLDGAPPPVEPRSSQPPGPVTDHGPGLDKLAPLVTGGYIRLATADDIAAWNAKASARLKSSRLAPFEAEYLHLGRTYVVLKSFTVPERMAGAYARNFIIPKGVELPADDGSSHNSYYLMADGRCIGASPDCRREELGPDPSNDASFQPRWRNNPWDKQGG